MTDQFTLEPRMQVVRRRLFTIPRSLIAFVLLVGLAPVVIPVAAALDAMRWLARRKPAMSLRLLAFGFVFLAVELIGLVWLAVSWVGAGLGRNQAKLREDAWPIQTWWARTLLGTAKRLFGLELIVTGQAVASPGPIIAMFRHASIVDNLLPAVLVTADLGINLRWIVKRELLTIPSLDVAGKRLPNYFVDRQSADPRGELRRIRSLAEDLTATDGVLIYPEGTRFTPRRYARAIAQMQSTDDRMLSRAQRLKHVMPPRPGGTLALLDSGADVVVGAHQGLEGFAKLGDIWSGALVGRTVQVRLSRIPASEIPTRRRERANWLYDVWQEVDDWITSQLAL